MAVTTDAEFLMKIKAKDDASKTLGGITSMAEGLTKSLGNASAAVIALNQGLELAKKVWGGLAGPVNKVLAAYAEQEKAERRLATALKLSGQYTKARVDGFNEFATQLQRTTTLGDESTLGMLATAKAMGLSDDMAKKLVQSSADLSAAMGIGVNEAFTQMQGTLVGMTRGVAKAIPQIQSLSIEQLKAGAGVEMVAARLAGSSAAMLRTWEGTLTQIKNFTGDIFEELGGLVADALTLPSDSQQAILDTLVTIKEGVKALRVSMVALRTDIVAVFDGLRAGFQALDLRGIITLFGLLTVAIAGAIAVMAPAAVLAAATALATLAKAVGLAALNYARMAAAAAAAAVKTTLVALGVMGTVLAIDLLVRNITRLKSLFAVFFSYVLGGLAIIGQAIAEALGMDKLAAYLEGKVQALAELSAESAEAIDTGLAGDAWKAATGFMDKFKDGMAESREEAEKLAKATAAAGDAGQATFGALAVLTDANKKALDDMVKRTETLTKKAQERGLSEIQLARLEQRRAEESAATLSKAIRDQGAMTGAIRKQIAAYVEAQKADTGARIAEAQKTALEEATKMARTYNDELLKIGLGQEELLDAQLAQELRDIELLREKLRLEGALTKEAEAQLAMGAGAARGKAAAKKGEMAFSERSVLYAADQLSQSFHTGMQGAMKGVFDGPTWKAAAGQLGDVVMISFAKAAPYIGKALEAGAEVIRGIFSGEYIDALASFVDSIGSLPETLMKAFGKLDVSIGKFIDQFPQLVESLAAKLPALITKIVDAIPRLAQVFVAALPKFVDAILAAIPKLVDAFVKTAPMMAEAIAKVLPKIVRAILDAIPALVKVLPQIIGPLLEAIPEIITAIMDKLPEIVSALFDAIPKIFVSIFRMIPTLIENLLENIDKFVFAFVEGFIGAIGEIVAAFIEEFLMRGGIERIIGAILRAIPRIVIALVKGIINGLARALKAFGFKGMKLPAEITELPERIADGAKQLGDRIAKDASQLFKVAEMTQAVRGQDVADRIRDAIDSATGTAAEELRSVWDALHNMLRRAWQWVIDNVWMPLAGFVQRAWSGIVAFFNGFGALISAAWAGIVSLFQGLGGIVSQAWKAVTDFFQVGTFYNLGSQLWAGLRDGLAQGATWLRDTLGSVGKSLWYSLGNAEVWAYLTKNLGNVGKNLFYALSDVWKWLTDNLRSAGKSIFYALSDVWDWLWDNLKKLGAGMFSGGGGGGGGITGGLIPGLAEGGWVKAMGLAGALYMANGGPIYAQTGMMVPRGTDTQPVMATPGEFIVNRASAQANAGLLTAINNGRGAVVQGAAPVTISVVINAKTNLTPDQIRTDVVPALEKALKRKSLEGGFVIASAGVRS